MGRTQQYSVSEGIMDVDSFNGSMFPIDGSYIFKRIAKLKPNQHDKHYSDLFVTPNLGDQKLTNSGLFLAGHQYVITSKRKNTENSVNVLTTGSGLPLMEGSSGYEIKMISDQILLSIGVDILDYESFSYINLKYGIYKNIIAEILYIKLGKENGARQSYIVYVEILDDSY